MLVDLGPRRLKDLERPEHIWQVIHTDLPSTFPALPSLDGFRHNLPVQLTPLIGRTTEIADVRGLLGGDRFVTLTGSAGVGKTRLALAVAAETVDSHPGGVWSVELAPLSDSDAVGGAVLAAIGAREVPAADAIQQLAVELGDQSSLLVSDNCEHLIAGCAAMVAAFSRRTHPRRSWPRVANPSVCRGRSRSGSLRCRARVPSKPPTSQRCRTTTRSSCSWSVPVELTHRSPSAKPTPPPSRRSVTAWTASLWPSSSPPPAAVKCRSNASPPNSTTVSGS